MYLTERPSLSSESKLVSYFKYPNTNKAPANMPENNSALQQKFRNLQSLREGGVITEDEFIKKKQQLLDKP